VNVLLINPPYQTITSNVGVGHQVPLGLLMVGGALQTRGHHVELLDAECRRLNFEKIVGEVRRRQPRMIMSGHAGSTPAHPVTMAMFRAIRQACPSVITVYGGVYPSYHPREILAHEPAVDFVVRGEGEATVIDLADSLASGSTPANAGRVAGIAYRLDGQAVLTPLRPPISDLDAYPIGWNLIDDWDAYRCFGQGRAAIVQFSRGCPHRCSYCGQHEFWVRWRYRDPLKVADEIEWLRQRYDIRFITLADENPTTRRDVWVRFLEELASRRLGVNFFATIRAADIVRDADLLPLYRRAGIQYILMGIESTSDQVLRQVHKGSTTRHDLQACRLLKANGIFSVIGQIVGLAEETPATFRAARRQLRFYDGDWLNAMYVTPHDWTPLGRAALTGSLVEPNLAKWDYRHQVLAQRQMTPLQIFLQVKWTELWFHLRPGRVLGLLMERDRRRQRQQLWVFWHIGCVWMLEIAEFIFTRVFRWNRKAERPVVGDSTSESIVLEPQVAES
jgi:anaerobic magnesium-protoporphyrin IX monomethyl ester cyclase